MVPRMESTSINGAVPTEHRGGVLSALYLLAYLSLGIVAIVLGAVATERGLGLAVNLGAGIITLLSLVTIGLAIAWGISGNPSATRSSIATCVVRVIVRRRR